MTLKPEDAALFYELFMPLLNYVNHNYHVTTDIDFTGKSVDPAEAMKVARNYSVPLPFFRNTL